MQWLPFQGIVSHIADNINQPRRAFSITVKILSMFKTSSFYDETIGIEDVPEYVGIIYRNCGK